MIRRFLSHYAGVFWLTALLLFVNDLSAQHQELQEKPVIWKSKTAEVADSGSLLYAFKKGTVHGHFRYFFMATENGHGLSDYYANAAGGGIRFETARFHGFQFAVSGFYVFNIGSSDFTQADTLTGQANRYEIALFDVTDPGNRRDIDRLEELYLRYEHRRGYLLAGRQLLNTPFINLQDGRMRPTAVQAIYGEWAFSEKWRLEGGWIYAVSPRGTTRWYNTDRSIGLYSGGVNEDGTRSQYASNLSSAGAFQAGVHVRPSKQLYLQAWNLFAGNIFNSALLQAEYQWPLTNGRKIRAGAQYIRQDAVNDGGNADQAKTYFAKGARSNTLGARLALETGKWDITVNYTRITADGRYLMPREWGRDPFYTFLPRERNEGFGDVHALMAQAAWKDPANGWRASMALGHYDLPSVSNTRLNKYGMPSYWQANVDLRYQFRGFLQGLEVQALTVWKLHAGTMPSNLKHVINKVDMLNLNLVLNYRF